MSETNGVSTAQKLKARARYPYTTTAGNDYALRRLNASSFIERGVFPPSVLYGSEDERRVAVDELHLDRPEGIHKLMLATLAAGLVDPPVWDGEDDECPDTHVTFGEVPTEDGVELFEEIMKGSGLRVSLIRGAAFRPGESGAGADPRPDRDEALADGAASGPA